MNYERKEAKTSFFDALRLCFLWSFKEALPHIVRSVVFDNKKPTLMWAFVLALLVIAELG